MAEKFNAFQFIGEFCLMRRNESQDYLVVKIFTESNGVVKYCGTSTVYNTKKGELTYTPDPTPSFIDESFIVLKPLI